MHSIIVAVTVIKIVKNKEDSILRIKKFIYKISEAIFEIVFLKFID